MSTTTYYLSVAKDAKPVTLCDTLGRTVVTGVHRSVSDPYLANQSVQAEYGGDGVLAGYVSRGRGI